jgi:carbon storage regulator
MEDKIMLVLSRKPGESIYIDGAIKVTIISTSGNRVKIGIDAPSEIPIVRSELSRDRDVEEAYSDEEACGDVVESDACLSLAQC